MKILVTGTDGYIGSVLAPTLLERGHEVVGVDTGFYRDGWLYSNGFHRFPPCLNRDVRRLTPEDLEGVEAVVHLAELSNDPLGQLNPEITYAINHRGTVAFAENCKVAGVRRFVYSSSCSVYGVGNEDIKTEESEANPQTAYARCKLLVETDLARLADARFSPVILRNATVYGASPRMRFDLVLNNLAGLAWTTGEIRLISDGTPWRPVVHVRDVCHAFICALEAPRRRVHNQIFNVGCTNENYRVRELAEIVAQGFPGCRMVVGPSDGDHRSYRVSFEKIKAVLPGWTCRFDARRGVQELRDLFERLDLTPELFQFRAFTRLKQIQYLLKTQQIDEQLFWRTEVGHTVPERPEGLIN